MSALFGHVHGGLVIHAHPVGQQIGWNGTEPLELPGGVKRSFLEDGDLLVMRGWCQGDGYRVGFGEVEGTIVPAG